MLGNRVCSGWRILVRFHGYISLGITAELKKRKQFYEQHILSITETLPYLVFYYSFEASKERKTKKKKDFPLAH